MVSAVLKDSVDDKVSLIFEFYNKDANKHYNDCVVTTDGESSEQTLTDPVGKVISYIILILPALK